MSFNEILGQGPALRALKRVVESGKVASAYLFQGPEGVGKKKAAISLAQALNCEPRIGGEKNGGDSCGGCPSCRAIERGVYGDLILLEPKGPIQVHHIDTIRTMQNFVNLRSLYGGWKVVVMDEAQRMKEEAAASLLKILEEPPQKTLFILVSSQPENIFKTILSRCQVIRFLPLAKDVQHKILKEYLAARLVRDKISNGVSDVVLSISNGGLKKALLLSTPEREAWRKEIFDWNAISKNIFSISQRIARGDDIEHKQDFIMDTLHLLFTWWRDILFIKQGLGEILNKDYEEVITAHARKISLSTLWGNLHAIICAQRDICHQVNSRLVLDTLFLRLCTK